MEATLATTRLLSSSEPSLAMVAEVPMHCRLLGPQALAHAAHEQRDVRTLSAAVGVQLVEHQEAQPDAVVR